MFCSVGQNKQFQDAFLDYGNLFYDNWLAGKMTAGSINNELVCSYTCCLLSGIYNLIHLQILSSTSICFFVSTTRTKRAKEEERDEREKPDLSSHWRVMSGRPRPVDSSAVQTSARFTVAWSQALDFEAFLWRKLLSTTSCCRPAERL